MITGAVLGPGDGCNELGPDAGVGDGRGQGEGDLGYGEDGVEVSEERVDVYGFREEKGSCGHVVEMVAGEAGVCVRVAGAEGSEGVAAPVASAVGGAEACTPELGAGCVGEGAGGGGC